MCLLLTSFCFTIPICSLVKCEHNGTDTSISISITSKNLDFRNLLSPCWLRVPVLCDCPRHGRTIICLQMKSRPLCSWELWTPSSSSRTQWWVGKQPFSVFNKLVKEATSATEMSRSGCGWCWYAAAACQVGLWGKEELTPVGYVGRLLGILQAMLYGRNE